jgi:hypothetical protein
MSHDDQRDGPKRGRSLTQGAPLAGGELWGSALIEQAAKEWLRKSGILDDGGRR